MTQVYPTENVEASDNIKKIIQCNEEDIESYFRFLSSVFQDPHKERYCGYWALGDGTVLIPGHEKWEGTYSQILPTYQNLIKTGYKKPNFHVTLNVTKGTGESVGSRKRADIEAVRVLCLDIDEKWEKEKVKGFFKESECQLVVESSPGKYHFYWRVGSELGLETWQMVQAGLASRYGGDLNLAQITHTIRVPGFRRLTKRGKGFTPRIVLTREDYVELGLEDVKRLFPRVIEEGSTALEEKNASRLEKVKKLKKGKLDLSKVKQDRNDTVYRLTRELVFQGNGSMHGVAGEDLALEKAVELNSQLPEPMDTEEVMTIAAKAYRDGSVAREEVKELKAKTQKENGKKSDRRLKQLEDLPRKFKYDFSLDETFSISRYSQQAVAARVKQAFPGHTVQVGDDLYSFGATDKCWRHGKAGEAVVYGYVHQVIQEMVIELRFIKEFGYAGLGKKAKFSPEKYQKEVDRRLSGASIGSSVNLYLKDDTHRKMRLEDFDKNRMGFYCANGYLDMVTGRLKPASYSDYLLHQSPIAWDAQAKCPYWKQLLLEILETPEMVDFMQELFGYTLSGSISEQKIYLHFGLTCNGKSTLLKTLGLLCGGYTAMLGPDALTRKRNGLEKEVKRIGYKVRGNRCMIIDDMEVGAHWNESLVKSLTGGSITAAGMRENEIDVPNRSKFHLGCNEPPMFGDMSKAMQRRMCLITYKVEFEASASKEAEIDKAIERELPGILTWAIIGYQRMLKRGHIEYPKEVSIDTQEYTLENPENNRIEKILKDVFRLPEKGTNRKKDWYSIVDLNAIIERKVPDKISPEGVRSSCISPIVLGRLLTKWGFEKKRKEHGTLTYYHVRVDEGASILED